MPKFFDNSLARHLEELRHVAYPFDEMRKLASSTQLDSKLAELRQQADILDKLSGDSTLKRVLPKDPLSDARKIMDDAAFRMYGQFVDTISSGIAKFDAPFLNALDEIRLSKRFIDDPLRGLDLDSAYQKIQGILTATQIDTGVLGGSSLLDRYADSLRDLHGRIASLYHDSLFNVLDKSLQESVFPSLAALRDGIIGPLSGLMIADPLERHGMFTWEGSGKRNPAFGSAVFFAASPSLQQLPPSSRKLFIECHIDCSICEDPMIAEEEERYWESPGKLRVSIRIVPICSACTRRAKESPDYWDEHLAHLIGKSRPSLHLIRGKGNGGTGPKSRSHLRLVKPEENDD